MNEILNNKEKEIINSTYDAVELFNQIANIMKPIIEKKKLDFTYNISSEIPSHLIGDSYNIKRIIISLINNAYKYTDRGFIHYEVKCINSNNISKLSIIIEDSGYGIKNEDIDNIFNNKIASTDNMNLTLSFIKELVLLMNGKIIVQTIYGEGSRFTLELEQKISDTLTTDNTDVEVLDVDTNNDNSNNKYDIKYLEENGVDIKASLELLGDMEMYNMTIKDFYDEIYDKWNNIVENKNNNNMAEYAVGVHSLKSDCKYLGFMKLADISYQHELKSKTNDIDFVSNNFSKLEEEYNKVLEIVKKYVENN